jgi:hypothetical protein
MKNILIFALLLLFSCKKINVEQEQQQVTPQATVTADVVLPTYNLYIPEDEGGWESPYESGRVGLFNGAKSIAHTTVNSVLYQNYFGKVPYGSYVKVCYYDCPIANGIPGETWDTTINNPITLSGERDYIVQGGVQQKPLSITVYANGDVFLGRKKDEFYYLPTKRRIGTPYGANHHGDTSFIWWGWMDNYNNTAIIPEADGEYVIAVTMDYGAINPQTSLLPIRVTGDVVVTDTTAIQANAAKSATNYKAVIQRGKIKGVNISWEGNGYAYCIERDGAMIVKWQDIRSYFDASGNKFSRYKIITRAQGRIPDNETPEFKVTTK